MATLDTTPDVVDIKHYAGDTLTIKVTVPTSYINGRLWKAQIKKDRNTATAVDATFVITPPAEQDGPAFLVLTAADSSRLAGTGAVTRAVRNGVATMIATYTGVWDCQLYPPTGDPVNSIVQGAITIEADVTRLP